MVLFAAPRITREALPWVLSIALELFVARHCWQIDYIPDHVHAISSAKWDLDPSGVGVTCQAPAEIGKLTAASFVVSILAQLIVVLVTAAINLRRSHSESTHPAAHGSGGVTIAANDDGVLLEGVPEVAYAAHGVAGFVFTGSVAARAFNLLVRHKRRYRHCPHVKVLGLFKFAVIANFVLLAWYMALAYSAFGLVVSEFFEARAINNISVTEAAPSKSSGNTSRAPSGKASGSKKD
jgi:hypothetical protein